MSTSAPINRRVTKKIYVGDVAIGGDAPISVQSMTNTDTCDVAATVAQIERCVDAGADLMRVSTPTMETVAALELSQPEPQRLITRYRGVSAGSFIQGTPK